MTNPYRGIYYVHGEVLFPTQIIVTKELDGENHKWLKAISGSLSKQQMRDLLDGASSFTQKIDQELVDSVLRVSIEANRQVVEEPRGEYNMEALLEFMKPEIDRIKESELKKSIECAIKSFRDLGVNNDGIKKLLVKNYGLSPEDAEAYL